MQIWRQQKLSDKAGLVIRGVMCLLASMILVGRSATLSSSGVNPTPLRPSLTTSSCDTPLDVPPVAAAEIDIGNASRPLIALTFDAGGPAVPTARILDILAKRQIHSTFFVTGDWANQNPDLVRRIHNDGHEIGNHTMHHPDLRSLPDQGVCTELSQAELAISSLTGVTTRPYYRPPYGGRDNRVRALAAQIGYRTVYWTIDTLDWQTTATPDWTASSRCRPPTCWWSPTSPTCGWPPGCSSTPRSPSTRSPGASSAGSAASASTPSSSNRRSAKPPQLGREAVIH